jgi:hypothetical protein
MRHLLPLSLLLNAALGSAAGFTGRLPARAIGLTPSIPVLPVTLPVLPLTQLPSARLPAVSGGVELPGKPTPLPMQLPAELVAPAALEAAPLAPAEAGGGVVLHLRWDLLDGDDDGLAGALVPLKPGPKPLPPAGAMAELEYASERPGQVFDAVPTPLALR